MRLIKWLSNQCLPAQEKNRLALFGKVRGLSEYASSKLQIRHWTSGLACCFFSIGAGFMLKHGYNPSIVELVPEF
jgi:hypothetical protein